MPVWDGPGTPATTSEGVEVRRSEFRGVAGPLASAERLLAAAHGDPEPLPDLLEVRGKLLEALLAVDVIVEARGGKPLGLRLS